MSMHLNKVSTTAVAGMDLGDIRDPLDINGHLQVSWQTIVGEPEGIRSPEWIWKFSSMSFNIVQSCTYKLLTILLAPLLALFLGFHFALLAFLQIWFGRPLLRLFYVIFHFVRSVLEIVLGSTLGPLCQTIGLCFSTVKVRHQRVYDAKEEPQFPFII